MGTFGIIGFIFGIIAYTTALNNAKKVKELESRINDLENKK
ncbi:hypothetical protein SAMN05880501_102149 [Ureibacillus xyleni]|uniref:Uncharacterized protein n=1 Tax=Ureibacillus xyleni TaxID=614648 RepID=A0A285RX81_9BACL|nr:hypothetical protein [Ureibacillus xyleni]SOB99097.1 hypothetical protein SAMN05880501_102149 [Ureibacillus xyleni]